MNYVRKRQRNLRLETFMKEEDAHDHEAKDRLVQMAGYNIKGLAEEDELQQLRRKKMEGKGIKAGVRPAEQVRQTVSNVS